MEQPAASPYDWRIATLAAILLAPLAYLLLLHDPIPQDPGYHMFADVRTCIGIPNFGNVASSIAFLLVGVAGTWWCWRNRDVPARGAWLVFFAGVALVFFGSAYYHWKPGNDTLVWDRLPMAVAFMGLFAALIGEHAGERLGRALLAPAVIVGAASVAWWHYSDDLRIYVWVQAAPLVAIPLLLALFPGRYTHRRYLLYGAACYALAKIAEHYDRETYALTSLLISGHTLKHLLAAGGPLCVYLMLRRRGVKIAPPGP
jgi:hypothetical protein